MSTSLHIDTGLVSQLGNQIQGLSHEVDQQANRIRTNCQQLEWQAPARAQFDAQLEECLQSLAQANQTGEQLAQRIFRAVDAWSAVAPLPETLGIVSGGGAGLPFSPSVLITSGAAGASLATWIGSLAAQPILALLTPTQIAALPGWLQSLLGVQPAPNPPALLPAPSTQKSGFGLLLERSAEASRSGAAQPVRENVTPPLASQPAPTASSSEGAISYNVPHKLQGSLLGGLACSPTSASMVLEYYHQQDPNNKTVSPAELINMLDKGDAGAGGISLSDMTDELNELGYNHIDQQVDASFADLKTEMANGPVIAIVPSGQIFHAIVVKGILADGSVLVNDPLRSGEVTYTQAEFESIWSKAKSSYYAIHP